MLYKIIEINMVYTKTKLFKWLEDLKVYFLYVIGNIEA